MYVITDSRISTGSLEHLKNYGFQAITLPAFECLAEPVASHTDMLIFFGFGKLFCHKKYYSANVELIDRLSAISDTKVVTSIEPIYPIYPQDVLFNACIIGDKLICNTGTVSRHILQNAEEHGYNIIDVSQGYTKCSIFPVSDNAIITSDRIISERCQNAGIDVLLIPSGNISLPGYGYGFIGGVGGVYGNQAYFCGSLQAHPNGAQISEFCNKHNRIAVSLSDNILQDVGSLFFI